MGRHDHEIGAALLDRAKQQLASSEAPETGARRLVETLALALSGSLLVRHAPEAVADAFCASRLAGDWGQEYGTLPPGLDLGVLLERARPQPD